jgi:peptidoglycan/xylan/chitin deacetylase (PgdA/CDA1 family)
MYHHIREGSNAMFRSPSKFKQDLESLYKMGFRPVTISEYVGNRMKLPPGASPVVMTFDDAHPNQFYIRKDGSIDPKCAVGIWAEFAKTHPDFPVKGTFYTLPVLWGQHKLIQQKIDMLRGWGSEIGNHTYNHRFLSRLNDDQVKMEIAKMNDLLVSYGIPPNMPFCPPYGEYPKNRSLVKMFKYNGKVYQHSSACMAWDSPAASPNDTKNFSRYRFERLHGNGKPMGIDWWLGKVKSGKVQVYVAP